MSATVTGITNERVVGPVVALIMLGCLAVANFVGEGENGGPAEFAVTAVIALALTAWVFGRVIPSARESGRTSRLALILAVVAVLTLFVFWSGLPHVLAPAAVVLGMVGPRNRESVAATVLGSAAYVLAIVAVFIG